MNPTKQNASENGDNALMLNLLQGDLIQKIVSCLGQESRYGYDYRFILKMVCKDFYALWKGSTCTKFKFFCKEKKLLPYVLSISEYHQPEIMLRNVKSAMSMEHVSDMTESLSRWFPPHLTLSDQMFLCILEAIFWYLLQGARENEPPLDWSTSQDISRIIVDRFPRGIARNRLTSIVRGLMVTHKCNQNAIRLIKYRLIDWASAWMDILMENNIGNVFHFAKCLTSKPNYADAIRFTHYGPSKQTVHHAKEKLSRQRLSKYRQEHGWQPHVFGLMALRAHNPTFFFDLLATSIVETDDLPGFTLIGNRFDDLAYDAYTPFYNAVFAKVWKAGAWRILRASKGVHGNAVMLPLMAMEVIQSDDVDLMFKCIDIVKPVDVRELMLQALEACATNIAHRLFQQFAEEVCTPRILATAIESNRNGCFNDLIKGVNDYSADVGIGTKACFPRAAHLWDANVGLL